MNEVSVTPATPARQTPAITAALGEQIWKDVQNEIPVGDDKLVHGQISAANYWNGYFTLAQAREFDRRTQKIIRAARKARKSVQA